MKWFGLVKHVHNSKMIVMGILYCFNSKQRFGKIKTMLGTNRNYSLTFNDKYMHQNFALNDVREAWVEFYIDKVKCLKWLIVTFIMHFEAQVVLGIRISNTTTISFNHSLMLLLDIKAKVIDQSLAWSS